MLPYDNCTSIQQVIARARNNQTEIYQSASTNLRRALDYPPSASPLTEHDAQAYFDFLVASLLNGTNGIHGIAMLLAFPSDATLDYPTFQLVNPNQTFPVARFFGIPQTTIQGAHWHSTLGFALFAWLLLRPSDIEWIRANCQPATVERFISFADTLLRDYPDLQYLAARNGLTLHPYATTTTTIQTPTPLTLTTYSFNAHNTIPPRYALVLGARLTKGPTSPPLTDEDLRAQNDFHVALSGACASAAPLITEPDFSLSPPRFVYSQLTIVTNINPQLFCHTHRTDLQRYSATIHSVVSKTRPTPSKRDAFRAAIAMASFIVLVNPKGLHDWQIADIPHTTPLLHLSPRSLADPRITERFPLLSKQERITGWYSEDLNRLVQHTNNIRARYNAPPYHNPFDQ